VGYIPYFDGSVGDSVGDGGKVGAGVG